MYGFQERPVTTRMRVVDYLEKITGWLVRVYTEQQRNFLVHLVVSSPSVLWRRPHPCAARRSKPARRGRSYDARRIALMASESALPRLTGMSSSPGATSLSKSYRCASLRRNSASNAITDSAGL